MLIKLLPNQIPTYQDVINTTINKSMEWCDEKTKTNLYKELLLDIAQCWLVYEEDKFIGTLITKIREEIAVGVKTFTLICMHAPEGTEEAYFVNNWEKLKEFGKANDCKGFDFYSNNEAAIKYARLFDPLIETTYFQIKI